MCSEAAANHVALFIHSCSWFKYGTSGGRSLEGILEPKYPSLISCKVTLNLSAGLILQWTTSLSENFQKIFFTKLENPQTIFPGPHTWLIQILPKHLKGKPTFHAKIFYKPITTVLTTQLAFDSYTGQDLWEKQRDTKHRRTVLEI